MSDIPFHGMFKESREGSYTLTRDHQLAFVFIRPRVFGIDALSVSMSGERIANVALFDRTAQLRMSGVAVDAMSKKPGAVYLYQRASDGFDEAMAEEGIRKLQPFIGEPNNEETRNAIAATIMLMLDLEDP